MKALIFIMLLYTAVSILLLACGVLGQKLDGRIVGGELIEIRDAPYNLGLLFDSSNEGYFVYACGAIILQSTAVLTAAHCVNGTQMAQWRMRIGSTYILSGGQVLEPISLKVHPDFNSKLDSDIAILFPRFQIIPGDGAIPAKLPIQSQDVPPESLAVVTGWGQTENGEFSVQLRKVEVPIVDQTLCEEIYSEINNVTERMLCAGYVGVGGKDSCFGDGGSPMTVDGVLVGLTSWGKGCGDPRYPGVYTNVAYFKTWVVNEMYVIK